MVSLEEEEEEEEIEFYRMHYSLFSIDIVSDTPSR